MFIRDKVKKVWKKKFNYKSFLKKYKLIRIDWKNIINLIIILLIFIFKILCNIKNLYINNTFFEIKKNFNINAKNKLVTNVRIAIYYLRIKNGGIERSTSMLINYFHKIKIFKIYLFTKINREEDEYIIPKNIKRIIIKNGKISNLIIELKKKKIDILIYQLYDAYSIKQLNKLNKTKTIIYNHSSIFFWINLKLFSIFNQTYQEYINSKYVISLVPVENDYIFKKWGINSVLMNNFMTYEYELISPSNLFSNTILMIGRADDKNKRFDLCFKAFEYILHYISDCKMNIISSINNTLFLQNLACNLNLENNIEFLGYASEPQIFFKNASLHILPSLGESFSMALCETKIFGIPNILIGLEYLAASSGGTIIIYDDSPELLAKESIILLL